ncbi:hypothetical protein VNI00_019355 [Paramarasmius palmivorus]|uniref:Uncharacterized protein n=1 Tax=Paramarasmius palmivorus TaxID=297713 RepID=A0AAW0AQU4_9AGAR
MALEKTSDFDDMMASATKSKKPQVNIVVDEFPVPSTAQPDNGNSASESTQDQGSARLEDPRPRKKA